MDDLKLTTTQNEYKELFDSLLKYDHIKKTTIAKWLLLSNSALTDREQKSDALLKIDIAILKQYSKATQDYVQKLESLKLVSKAIAEMRY